MTRTARLVARSLRERPQDWDMGEYGTLDKRGQPYRLRHLPTGRSIWVGNGRLGYKEDDVPKGAVPWPPFGFFDRRHLHPAIREWLRVYAPTPLPEQQEASPADFGFTDAPSS